MISDLRMSSSAMADADASSICVFCSSPNLSVCKISILLRRAVTSSSETDKEAADVATAAAAAPVRLLLEAALGPFFGESE